MFSALLIFGCLAACSVPGRCCRPEEYLTASNGQCCPMCHEGTVVQKDCEPDSGTQCVPCESGTFMNKANGLNKCFPCTSCDRGLDANQRIIVGDGLFAKQSCNPKNDIICDVLNGHYCISFNEETGCSLAEKHKRCTPGQRIKEDGTRKSDTVCEDCQPGHFSQDGVDCIAQTICTEGQVKFSEGSLTEDVICANASRNHYCFSVILPSLLTVILIVIKVCSTKQR